MFTKIVDGTYCLWTEQAREQRAESSYYYYLSKRDELGVITFLSLLFNQHHYFQLKLLINLFASNLRI